MRFIEKPYFRNDYLDYLEKKKINYAGDIKFSSNPYLQSLTDYPINEVPQFVRFDELEELKICTSNLPKLILKLIRFKLENKDDDFFKMIGYSGECISKSINKNILDNLCCRADLILTENGFKVVELNVATNLGGWDIRFHEEAFIESKLIKSFLAEGDFKIKCRDPLVNYIKMLSSSIEKLDPHNKDTQYIIAVVTPNFEKSAIDFIMSTLNSIVESQSSNIKFNFIKSVDEITHDNDKGYIDGNMIHGITFPARTWEKGDRHFTEEILNLWWSDNIILPENPVSISMGDKRVLSLLWQERNNVGYTDDELEFIEKFIPVSSPLISCDITLREIIDNKDNFVIKPGIGLQGERVLVGKYVTSNHWKDIISNQYGKPDFLLQHYESSIPLAADSAGEISCYKGVWGAFSFGLEYSGVWIRMCMDNSEFNGVINSALGATESMVFEIHNKS